MEFNTPKLINVKVKYLREIYDKEYNIEKWINNKNNLYIGRRNRIFIKLKDNKKIFHLKNSKYYNPFKIDKDTSRKDVVKKYELYAREKFAKEEILNDLNNKTLGCWCYPEDCHGNVLIKLFNEYKIEK